ncbi:MAG: MBOAT family protein, partial [Symbiobacteriaceae bacterium]|nr:MBOAT family protein [Symbiobacteriaceae bacterium]
DFFIGSFNSLLGTNIPLWGIPLPIGISFYTFQTMSYSIDVYRNQVATQKNFISFAAFVTMFPQLIAGPIVRYIEVAKELQEREESVPLFAQGVEKFVLGLGYKVLLANTCGELWVRFKALPTTSLSALSAWLGIIAYALQIYFDFAGYSQMAIGMGEMLGFKFPQNFNYPYVSQSITEFWRRWHMTLGTWFREYVYIPLGGNRRGLKITLRNLAVVWLLTGIWHGASWNFLLWGCYYGLIIILERVGLGALLEKLPRALRHIYTLFLVLLGWVLFEAENLAWGRGFLAALFGVQGLGWGDHLFRYEALSYGTILLISMLVATELPEKLLAKVAHRLPRSTYWLRFGVTALGLGLSLAYIIDSSYNPFLYFRF